MKNVKKFEEFLNEGFLNKSKNDKFKTNNDKEKVIDSSPKDDDDVAEKILNYVSNNNIELQQGETNELYGTIYYRFKYKNSTIDSQRLNLFIDDEHIEVNTKLANDIFNKCTELYKLNKKETIKKNLSKFRNDEE
jgi:hypothetical protein